MLGRIHLIDQTVTTIFANIFPHTPLFDLVFAFFSLEGITIFIWGFVISALIIGRQKQYKELLFYFFLSVSITWLLVNVVIKNVVQRDRPWVAQQLSTTICPRDFSFPSGHASAAFAGATVFAYYDKKRRWIYYTIALLVSYSRVYLYCHYLLDVSIGALIGYIISSVTFAWLPYRNKLKQT